MNLEPHWLDPFPLPAARLSVINLIGIYAAWSAVVMEHRQDFSSEATVLISCSLNVIMVMITQMTPGLWGDPWFTHPRTGAAQWLHQQTTRLSRSWWPALFCPCWAWKSKREWLNEFHAATKELNAMREMDIFCCQTLNAVFQSNYLSPLQLLLSAVHGIVALMNSDWDP